jgi:hypothetical protein
VPCCAPPKWNAGPNEERPNPANPVFIELAMVEVHTEDQINEIQMNE